MFFAGPRYSEQELEIRSPKVDPEAPSRLDSGVKLRFIGSGPICSFSLRELAVWINQQPGQRACPAQKRCHSERGSPAKVGRDQRCERGGNRAADLCAHVHDPGYGTGRLARDVGGYGPEHAL